MPGATWNPETFHLTVSQSWLNTYRMCPEQARQLLLDPDSAQHTDASIVGIEIHDSIAAMIEDNLPWEDMVEPTINAIALRWGDIKHTKPEWDSVSAITPKVVHCLSQAEKRIENWVVDGSEVEVESKFEFSYAENVADGASVWVGNVTVQGSPDLVVHHPTGDSYILDWKTGRAKKGWEIARYALQPKLYCVARKISPFVHVFLDPDGRQSSADEHVLEIRDFDAAAEQIRSEIQPILAQLMFVGPDRPWPIRPDGWHCSPRWCPVYARGECMGRWPAFHHDAMNY